MEQNNNLLQRHRIQEYKTVDDKYRWRWWFWLIPFLSIPVLVYKLYFLTYGRFRKHTCSECGRQVRFDSWPSFHDDIGKCDICWGKEAFPDIYNPEYIKYVKSCDKR